MPPLQAWQHIYANVEQDRSPTRTSGFQTLFASRGGLAQDDIDAIESRVFYRNEPGRPRKWIFFQTPSGKVVLGQAAATGDRDAAGRSGLYLAHSLVFESVSFLQAGLSPLDLINQVDFITDLDTALARGDARTGDIGALTLEQPDQRPLSNPTWPPEARRALARFAAHLPSMRENLTALALVGAPEAIGRALAEVLHFVPGRLLPDAAFDTWFEKGGNLSFTYCWAAGFRTPPRQPGFRIVDADRCVIEASMRFGPPASSYGRWVDHRLLQDPAANLDAEKNDADLACRFLDGERVDASELDRLPSAVIHDVLVAQRAHQALLPVRAGRLLLLAKSYDAFEAQLPELDPGERSALLAWCRERPDIPENIRKALENEEPSKTSSRRASFFGRLLGRQ